MSAPILPINAEHPQPRHVERVLSILQNDGLIAYPTDLSYAIGCDLFSKKAIEKLYLLKQRDRKKPLSFICPDLSDLANYARVSNFVYRTLKGLTPGPFTFVLEATRIVPQMMMNKQKQVGIRVPEAPFVVALTRGLQHPLVSSSCTDADGNALVDPKDIRALYGHGLELILDAGILGGEQTTVVSLLDDQIEILRQGAGEIAGLD